MKSNIFLTISALAISSSLIASEPSVPGIVEAIVDFGAEVREWDGFGVNYVETAQTYDYNIYPQDYGGFSKLDQSAKDEILEMTFGEDGLQPSIIKLFLDPLHQEVEDGPYNHTMSTGNMLYFAKEGMRISAERNEELSFITTMYSGPAYTTQQNVLRGRDINVEKLPKLADYMGDWADFLINEEEIPLRYISIHNEGESWRRWEPDGGRTQEVSSAHDYNVYMTPQMTIDVMRELRKNLNNRGLKSVGVTNGEPSNWYRFWSWNYAGAIAKNKQAVKDLDLITSHGFFTGYMFTPRWFGTHAGNAVDALQKKKPSLHAWSTSVSWNFRIEDFQGNKTYVMDPLFLKMLHSNIYEARVNAIIPWACLQNPSNWSKPDPNPGCGFRVYDDGTWEVQKGYFYYKQVTRAGKPKMQIVEAYANDSEIALIGFGRAKTDNPNAFVLINWGTESFDVKIKIEQSDAATFDAYRTSGRVVCELHESASNKLPEGDNYKHIGQYRVDDGYIFYRAEPLSATTFFEE